MAGLLMEKTTSIPAEWRSLEKAARSIRRVKLVDLLQLILKGKLTTICEVILDRLVIVLLLSFHS